MTFVQMQIFFPGSQTTADMTLLFVDVQHIPDRPCQGRVDLLKAIGTVFMYRRLTDPKLLCSLPNRGIMFNDIFCDLDRSFLDITFQVSSSAIFVFTIYAEFYTIILSHFHGPCIFIFVIARYT